MGTLSFQPSQPIRTGKDMLVCIDTVKCEYEWMFLIVFDIMYLSYFSLKQNNNFVVRKAFTRFYHGFFWSEENVVLNYFLTQDGVWCCYAL